VTERNSETRINIFTTNFFMKLTQKLGGRTTYKTLSLNGRFFKLGLNDDPICERCLEEDESATHILCDCEAVAHIRFRHLSQFFMEQNDQMCVIFRGFRIG
jgi:hypothetical protein